VSPGSSPGQQRLTHEQFTEAVANFTIGDVNAALVALPGSEKSPKITATIGEDEERLRAVVDAEAALFRKGPDGKAHVSDLATLRVNYKLCTDAYGLHLAVEQSTFELKAALDRAPIIRWDYDRHARAKPHSHVQVFAHRGALSHLLSQLGHNTPGSMESLHMPMGGERFRPCLEDVIEFLITDCGFCGGRNWQNLVRQGRAKWRRLQTRSVVRDAPTEAAEALRALGYTVTAPQAGEAEERAEKLTGW
jgi:hypothetical protein